MEWLTIFSLIQNAGQLGSVYLNFELWPDDLYELPIFKVFCDALNFFTMFNRSNAFSHNRSVHCPFIVFCLHFVNSFVTRRHHEQK